MKIHINNLLWWKKWLTEYASLINYTNITPPTCVTSSYIGNHKINLSVISLTIGGLQSPASFGVLKFYMKLFYFYLIKLWSIYYYYFLKILYNSLDKLVKFEFNSFEWCEVYFLKNIHLVINVRNNAIK